MSGPAGSSNANLQEVRIRMYRQGLGDCFLLTFPRPEGGPFFMVIDCGVFTGTDDMKEKLAAVASDIKQETIDVRHANNKIPPRTRG